MVSISFNPGDYRRNVPHEAELRLVNRYYEQNPSLSENGAALIARPGMRRFVTINGDGPGRGIYSAPGTFSDALFTVFDIRLYRTETDGTTTEIMDDIFPGDNSISMAATGAIGTTPEHLFIADGNTLWLYIEDGYARGTLTASSTINNGEQVRIGDTYYQFTTGSVDSGSPAGTSGNPWLVAVGIDADQSLENLANAIDANGTAGTQYSTATTAHPTVEVFSNSTDTLTVRYKTAGAEGNTVVTTETGTAMAWGAGTLEDGGTEYVQQVSLPDGLGAVAVATINSYIIVIPTQTPETNGRFYWIEPGEVSIDPLNFATAESAPDPVQNVVVFGDQIYFPGENKTEVWYTTGQDAAPFRRLQGVAFDRGTWEGTAVQVKESMMIVDSDGGVFQITGGGMQRISNPSIEERIREAIRFQSYTNNLGI